MLQKLKLITLLSDYVKPDIKGQIFRLKVFKNLDFCFEKIELMISLNNFILLKYIFFVLKQNYYGNLSTKNCLDLKIVHFLHMSVIRQKSKLNFQ